MKSVDNLSRVGLFYEYLTEWHTRYEWRLVGKFCNK